MGHRLDPDDRWGTSAKKLRAAAVARWPGARVLTAATYVHPDALGVIDFPGVIYPGHHYLEWNLFNTGLAGSILTDLDGILCPDIRPEDDDDGPRYLAAIRGARALHRPTRRPVAAIVTGRLEKWRAETVAWLDRSGIRYARLVMGPWATAAERWTDGPNKVADWKAAQYQAAPGCPLFVESDPAQASIIAGTTGRQVLCPRAGARAQLPGMMTLGFTEGRYSQRQGWPTPDSPSPARPELPFILSTPHGGYYLGGVPPCGQPGLA